MNSTSPLTKDWTTVGRNLYSASSAEEREVADFVLNSLFEGDTEGKQKFVERFLGIKDLTAPAHLRTCTQEHPTRSEGRLEQINCNHQQIMLVGLSDGSKIREFVVTLNTIPSDTSALAILRHQVEIFFNFGPDLASFVFAKLQDFASAGLNELIESKFEISLSGLNSMPLSQWSTFCPWNSCKMAATLVLFAAPWDSKSLFFAVKTQSRSLGGLPTLKHIRETPSASLDTAYRRTKKDAFGDGKRTTVMAVNLTDVHIFELAEQGKSELYFSLAHVFVIAVGPEGVVIWQSWGKFGYSRNEYLNRDGGRLRDWQAAEQFVSDFTKLVSGEVSEMLVLPTLVLSLFRGPGRQSKTNSRRECFTSILTTFADLKGLKSLWCPNSNLEFEFIP